MRSYKSYFYKIQFGGKVYIRHKGKYNFCWRSTFTGNGIFLSYIRVGAVGQLYIILAPTWFPECTSVYNA